MPNSGAGGKTLFHNRKDVKFGGRMQKLIIVLFLSFAVSSRICAENGREPDDDFIKASVLVAQPGSVLYSCIGHAFLRMECPAHHLDYCFSYESEDVSQRVLTFLAGRLKMGMIAIPTSDFLDIYRGSHRGVASYELHLSVSQKQRLWQLLDERVAQGTNIPYDYMARGCVHACVQLIHEAVQPDGAITYGEWPQHFSMSRRELVRRQLDRSPWTAFILYFLVGTEGDREVSLREKIITPLDMIEVLQHATVNEHRVLDRECQILVPYGDKKGLSLPFLSPVVCASLMLLVTLICLYKHWMFCIWPLLVIQAAWGILLVYLFAFSSLPCTSWNWLIVPFNPLPLLLWPWRRWWLLPYSAVLAVWLLGMKMMPHEAADNAHYILTINLIIIFIYQYQTKKKNL